MATTRDVQIKIKVTDDGQAIVQIDRLGKGFMTAQKAAKQFEDAIKRQDPVLKGSVADYQRQIRALKTVRDNSAKTASAFAKQTKAIEQLQIKQRALANEVTNVNKVNEDQISNAGLAGATLTEFGRTISDLPYGIRGVANNISQLSTLFTTLAVKSGNVKNSIGLLLKQLRGPLGIVLAIQAVVAALDFFAGSTSKAKEETDALTIAMNESGGMLATMRANAKVMEDSTEGSEEFELALKDLKSQGYDPLIESVDAFIERQVKLAFVQAQIKIGQEEFIELQKERLEAQEKADKRLAAAEGLEFTKSPFRTQAQITANNLITQYRKAKAEVDELDAKQQEVIDKLAGLQSEALTSTTGEPGKATKGPKLGSILGFKLPTSDELEEIMNEAKNQLQKITDSMREKKEELDAEDEAARIELRRTRAIADIEAITNDEVAKREAILATNAYYDSLEEARKEEQAAKDTARRNKMMEQKFDDLARLFGEETKFGQASLLLKMNFANIEKAINEGVTWESIKNSVVTGTTDFFEGIGKAAKAAPFPFNLPLIAGQIATASPFLLQLKAAVGLFKGKKKGSAPAIPSLGGGGAGGAAAAAASIQAPDFNVVGATAQSQLAETVAGTQSRPLRAFVVGKDITTQQELDRNTRRTASFGG